MRFDRKLLFLATIVFALVLTTTDAYSDSLNIIVHLPGGTVTDIVYPPGADTSLPVGEYSGLFTVVPDSHNQVAKALLFEGSKELEETDKQYANKYQGDLIEILPSISPGEKYNFQNVDFEYSYDEMNINYTYSNKETEFTLAIYFESAPAASFVVDKASGTEEPPAVVTFTYNGTSENIPSEYLWNFGDGSATSDEQNPQHNFASSGTFPVSLTVFNALGQPADTAVMDYITIPPTIDYTASAGPNGFITGPDGVITLPGDSPRNYNVDEGSSNTFTITPDTHYQVADVLVDGVSIGAVTSHTFQSSDIADHDITASFEPIPVIAGFSSDLASGNITTSDPVQFTDNSQNNPVSWLWDFGDGNTSTEQNPSYTFANDGTFTVTLTVGNALTTDMISAAYTVDPSDPPGIVKLEGASKEYEHLQDAYDDVLVSETIKLSADEPIVPLDVDGNLYFNRNVTVILKGGYDNNFETFNGFSRIHGNVIISDGIVEMSEVIIAPAPAI